MPSLFRRKSASSDVIEDAQTEASGVDAAAPNRSKGYTPSKRELGVATPKRKSGQARKAEPPPANRREAYKRMRERQRAERAEQRAGMMAGDDRYLLPRDKGPERALVRDVVDSRHTVGSWFLGGAILVLVGSSIGGPEVQLASNMLWLALALAVVVDSLFICLRVRKLVLERHPKTTQRMGGLYMYAVMRSLSMRRMRIPKPRVRTGAKI